MSGPPLLRPAYASDMPRVRELLSAANLPLDGLDDCHEVFVEIRDLVVLGAVGYELHGRVALLRSLVVAPAERGRGLGLTLILRGITAMRNAGAVEAYGLTTTIPDLLLRLGWDEVPRGALPKELNASKELQGACPASARSFRFTLAEGAEGPP